ncbi:MAG: site-specific integrase, partial [Ruminococcus sp.]|nr:site-specific integrase [Ruminococcus sp.]
MRIIKDENIRSFLEDLINREMSNATLEKYRRDILSFVQFSDGKSIDKQLCMDYKAHLEEAYAVSSANSMIASDNTFFKYMEWFDCWIRQFKVQKKVFCSEEDELTKNEYLRLLKAAQSRGNERLYLVLQTICGTGIRVSELKYITVEALKTGSAEVSCKGKNRVILIVSKLRTLLKDYVRKHSIVS